MTAVDQNLAGMAGRHPTMRAIYRLVRQVAPTDMSVLIVGETGTGKELVAAALHALRWHRKAPFIDVNAAALPVSLAESELLGSEQGAFTGAVRRRRGFIELANGGTLFLDEICSMSLGTQAKLLRAIEQRRFWRVGGTVPVRSSFRLVSAISSPLAGLVREGRLRRDLAYRLAEVEVAIPPLRDRRSDIPVIARQWLIERARSPDDLLMSAVRELERHTWPGNVRELQGVLSRACLAADDGVISDREVRAALNSGPRVLSIPELLATVAASGSVAAAARSLGIPRTTLQSRLASSNSGPG
ncbi:MAG TPA: sigma 54-interacting transcriptional regulator [Gemmatimonadales bacterium]